MMTNTTNTANKSIRGRIWSLRRPDTCIQRELEDRGLQPAVAGILSSRGIKSAELDGFLEPKIRNTLPDPSRFRDMDAGIAHIANDMQAGRVITIWSDYDCDGVTSASILKRFFRLVGFGEVNVYIPDRIKEGYGPNANGLQQLKTNGVDTVCILDSGIVAFEALTAARDAGLKAVIIDHHTAEKHLPPAIAVINANRLDETPGYGHLCAAGMVFVFCVGLARELKKRGWFDGQQKRPAQLSQESVMSLLDMVALGTVADVVPLTTLNRTFVTRGLKHINSHENPGLRQLALVSGIKPNDKLTAMDLGWKLGPRINAGGRIANAMTGVELLTTENVKEAEKLARQLDEINARRKTIEQKTTKAALEQFSDRTPGIDRKIALAVIRDAHEGVVGISAGRLREAYDAPAIVLTNDHEGNLKGSARSVPGFDIGQAIITARNTGIIIKGGGHAMAAGMSLTQAQLKPFEAFMNAEIKKSDYFRDGLVTQADVQLQSGQLTVNLIDAFNQLQPFGAGNPTPEVILEGMEIRDIRILKETHLKLTLSNGNEPLTGLLWGGVETPLGDFLQNASDSRIDILGEPQINEFRGKRSPQIIIEDIRPHKNGLL